MQIKIFNIPVSDDGSQLEDVNAFLRSHKVLDMEQKLLQSEYSGSWCFCIRYIEGQQGSPLPPNAQKYAAGGQAKKDYREILEAPVFAIFSRLRECRKQMANEDGVAAYIIFTDEELSGIAQLSEITEQTMRQVNGIGVKKIEKYATRILSLYGEKKKVDVIAVDVAGIPDGGKLF
jgi:superfamily II DNA helicase RecQ